MTNPTWKDPLLAEWWEGCSEETKRVFKRLPLDTTASVMLERMALYCGEWDAIVSDEARDAIVSDEARDAARLRTLIDAELAGARRAKEVAKVWANPTSTLPPDAWDMGAKRAANAVLEAFESAERP